MGFVPCEVGPKFLPLEVILIGNIAAYDSLKMTNKFGLNILEI
jgi:hypothetical protein